MASQQENQRQLHILFESIGYRNSSHPVLVAANEKSMPIERFLSLTADEVDEKEVEYQKWEATNDLAHKKTTPHKDLLMEFVDVLVMLRSVRARVAPNFSVERAIFSSNDKPRADFNLIKEQIFNINEGNGEHNFQLLFGEFFLLLRYLDIELQAAIYIGLMNKKLNDNRESRFYQREPGMTEADMLLKYDHVTNSLRAIRNFLRKATGQEVTLQPWITDFFAAEILGWRDSKLSMVLLQQKLLLFQQQIKDEVVWKLTPKKSRNRSIDSLKQSAKIEKNGGDPSLELKMLLAGAKLVAGEPIRKNPVQQRGTANATLGQTIFWV